MPGTLIKLYIKEGDQVKKGANLLTLEAMKMEVDFNIFPYPVLF